MLCISACVLTASWTVWGQEQSDSVDAATIVNRGIVAQGGRDKLARLARAYLKTTTKVNDVVYSMETWRDLPFRVRQIVRQSGEVVLVQVITEKDAWEKIKDQPTKEQSGEHSRANRQTLERMHA